MLPVGRQQVGVVVFDPGGVAGGFGFSPMDFRSSRTIHRLKSWRPRRLSSKIARFRRILVMPKFCF